MDKHGVERVYRAEQVARAVLAKYPELRVYYTRDRAWKERFHQNMFDAVALGVMVNKGKKE